ncbi:MAG TPA: hypothetical protein VFH99_02630 [Candidatus Saccharimonadales bacterium]|nr:hypothetical protein [Candidatus Saccharimonadales bacterium]
MSTIGEVATAEADIFEGNMDALKEMYIGLGHSALADRTVAEGARSLYERALIAVIDSGIVIEGLSEDSELKHVSYDSNSQGDVNTPLDASDIRRLHQHFEPVHFSLAVPGITPEQDPESREVQPKIFFKLHNFGYQGILNDIEWRRIERSV